MQNSNEDIIDLTSSDFNHHSPRNNNNNPPVVCDEVINLTNDSFHNENKKHTFKMKTEKRSKADVTEKTNDNTKKGIKIKNAKCSLCKEKLGINPMAATWCGHVFCLECIKKSWRRVKRCPVCKRGLKKVAGYHPLYLELG